MLGELEALVRESHTLDDVFHLGDCRIGAREIALLVARGDQPVSSMASQRRIPDAIGEPVGVFEIFDVLLAAVPTDRLVAVSIPDYTVTPAGADYGDPAQKRTAIIAANGVMAELCGERGVALVDIFDLSSRAAVERELIANDGLHPSGRQYGLWVDRIAPVAARLLDGQTVA